MTLKIAIIGQSPFGESVAKRIQEIRNFWFLRCGRRTPTSYAKALFSTGEKRGTSVFKASEGNYRSFFNLVVFFFTTSKGNRVCYCGKYSCVRNNLCFLQVDTITEDIETKKETT